MPQPVPTIVRDAYVAIISAAPYPGGPGEADMIISRGLLQYYTDVETVLKRQLDLFAANNAYLMRAISVFDDTELQNVGIWVNKTVSSPPLTDPIMIINSTYADVTLTPNTSSPPVEKTLTILGSSNIGLIYLTEGTILDELYIGPGSIVDVLNASTTVASPPSYTAVNTLWLPFMRSTPSTLKSVVYESIINQVVMDEGSYYGGISEDPQVTCADAVTGMQATEITKNAILVSWTLPIDYLFITPWFRKTNSKPWILATEIDGDFVNDVGFIFRHLESDTYYDFKATVTCQNGGTAKTEITTKTVCCGAGTQLSLYKVCPITILFTNTPSSPPLTQVLCNGVSIDLQYPPGTTVAIPYLATVNCAVLNPVIIDNGYFQNFPYNPASGTWDASTTSILRFEDGDTMTVNVSLPA